MTWLSVWYQSCLILGDFVTNSTAAPSFDAFEVAAILRSSKFHKLCTPILSKSYKSYATGLSKRFSLKHTPQLRYKYSQIASVRLCQQICNQLTTPNHSTQNILHCSLNVHSLHYKLRRPWVPPKPEILANPKTYLIMSLANANRKHGLLIIYYGHGLSTTWKTNGHSLYNGCRSAHHGSQGILDQFPGDPWIHACNGYCKVY